MKNVKDRRESLPESYSVADYETQRKLNLKNGFYACVCGSRRFHLHQQLHNVKAICSKCGNADIIYWNGPKGGDSSRGHMRNLISLEWVS